MRKSYDDYPRLVAVETTSRCNAECPFCPYNVKQRDKMNMPQELFLKIIDECREFPLDRLEPFLNGEPWVDPRITERLDHIKRVLPRTKLGVYSNGYGLGPKKIDELVAIGGVDKLVVSLNTLDAERYRSIMGFGLDRTLSNMRYLVDPVRREKAAREIVFRMTRMDDTSLPEQDRFVAFCRELSVRPMISGLFNYKGDIPSGLPVPSYPCEHIDRLDILSDGKVTLCCQDHEGEYSWGDLRTHSVLEVYRGTVARRYRDTLRAGRRREIDPCNRCNLFWPSLNGMGLLRTAQVAVQAGWYYARYRPIGRHAPSATKKLVLPVVQEPRGQE
jgi:radical SAM family protein/iron-sulfur cluster protein